MNDGVDNFMVYNADGTSALTDKNGNVVPVFEVMHINSAIRALIRDNKSHQISNVMAASNAEGMITMDQALLELYHADIITFPPQHSRTGRLQLHRQYRRE